MYRYLSSMVWKVCRRIFFKTSITSSFSESCFFSARFSASSSRMRRASRFCRSMPPALAPVAAFSHERSVSIQMPSSLATSVLGRPCSMTMRIAPVLNASSYRGGAFPFFFFTSISYFPFPFHYIDCFFVRQIGKGGTFDLRGYSAGEEPREDW